MDVKSNIYPKKTNYSIDNFILTVRYMQRTCVSPVHIRGKEIQRSESIITNHIKDLDDRLMLTAVGLWNFYLMAA